jgi:hypothetical protein
MSTRSPIPLTMLLLAGMLASVYSVMRITAALDTPSAHSPGDPRELQPSVHSYNRPSIPCSLTPGNRELLLRKCVPPAKCISRMLTAAVDTKTARSGSERRYSLTSKAVVYSQQGNKGTCSSPPRTRPTPGGPPQKFPLSDSARALLP